MGILAGMTSFFGFAIIVIGCLSGWMKKAYYFGLIPTFATNGDAEPTGWFAFFMRIWNMVRHPFLLNFNQDAFEGALQFLLVPEKDKDGASTLLFKEGDPIGGIIPAKSVFKNAVFEEFFEATRKAGAIPREEKTRWDSEIDKLSVIGTQMF